MQSEYSVAVQVSVQCEYSVAVQVSVQCQYSVVVQVSVQCEYSVVVQVSYTNKELVTQHYLNFRLLKYNNKRQNKITIGKIVHVTNVIG